MGMSCMNKIIGIHLSKLSSRWVLTSDASVDLESANKSKSRSHRLNAESGVFTTLPSNVVQRIGIEPGCSSRYSRNCDRISVCSLESVGKEIATLRLCKGSMLNKR